MRHFSQIHFSKEISESDSLYQEELLDIPNLTEQSDEVNQDILR